MDGLAANDINNGFAHFSCMQLTAELTALHCTAYTYNIQFAIHKSHITNFKPIGDTPELSSLRSQSFHSLILILIPYVSCLLACLPAEAQVRSAQL
jgi:hypothetical protein